MQSFTVETRAREELLDITARIRELTASAGIRSGVCFVYVPHTTAGITINENADPSVKADILMALGHAVRDNLPYTHAEGNAPAHVKSTLVGSSAAVLIHEGRPALGTWQGIFLCEFDGPRKRKVLVEWFASD
ncbi:MAG: secondary thiamine-phosphate synthase enzyme YjbQ [Candidatus Aminicenantales bacterium]